jgi:hypothetical protein
MEDDDIGFFSACWERANPEPPEPLPPIEDPGPFELEQMLDDLNRPGPPSDVLPLEPQGDITEIVQLAEPLERVAQDFGIPTVFDDGGYKTLIMCKLLGLRPLPGKRGDDAVDAEGRRFELKTVNLLTTMGEPKKSLGVTTEHTLRQSNIDRYRQTNSWLIGVFRGFYPVEVWQLPSDPLSVRRRDGPTLPHSGVESGASDTVRPSDDV